MRKLLVRTLITIVAYVFIFLCFAFVSAKMNPFEWSSEDRGVVVFVGTIIAFVLNGFLSRTS